MACHRALLAAGYRNSRPRRGALRFAGGRCHTREPRCTATYVD
ncbi:hypothetical protein ANDA3_4278 [plant metagenome]|uniref:Uncharacterized protein n=2 Tax=root TaxID=1 RepID=A0A1C3K2E6_9BURK|nr:hypothetical protein ODI_01303 [Orrella dioscoreae]SOE52161.1 hypothetical protein ODI_R3964 [Orrella dioscoreae]